jgi:hypothetical protein
MMHLDKTILMERKTSDKTIVYPRSLLAYLFPVGSFSITLNYSKITAHT